MLARALVGLDVLVRDLRRGRERRGGPHPLGNVRARPHTTTKPGNHERQTDRQLGNPAIARMSAAALGRSRAPLPRHADRPSGEVKVHRNPARPIRGRLAGRQRNELGEAERLRLSALRLRRFHLLRGRNRPRRAIARRWVRPRRRLKDRLAHKFMVMGHAGASAGGMGQKSIGVRLQASAPMRRAPSDGSVHMAGRTRA